MKSEKFLKGIKKKIDYAFQPIVTSSGTTIGVEALIRKVDKLNFPSIDSFFEYLVEQKVLFQAEFLLRKKVFSKFKTIPFYDKLKLFYNYDHRVFEMPDYKEGMMEKIMKEHNVRPDTVCIEATEKIEHVMNNANMKVYRKAKKTGINFAIDDFGVAFSNIQLLYFMEPNFIKIDKFFVMNCDSDNKKRFFCEKIVEIAHTIGSKVIAEGVETIKEYFTLKGMGVDAFQGFLISKPVLDTNDIKNNYPNIKNLYDSDKRVNSNIDNELLELNIEKIKPIKTTDHITDVFHRFKELKNIDCIPVVDSTGNPVGIIREKGLRDFIYSPYGKNLLSNSAYHISISEFVKSVGICDIKDNIDKMLDVYSKYIDSEGIIIKDEFKYVGFLNSKSLIKILNEKKILEARDLNPLTKLPGNISVEKGISKIITTKKSYDYLIYYDFNNFKPFNDKYGFRIGDRAILNFGEILQKCEVIDFKKSFTGHIGGDDFIQILSSEKECFENIVIYIKTVFRMFKDFVKNIHDEVGRKNGYYISKDRYGRKRKFPLLDTCAALIEIPPIKSELDEITFSRIVSEVKKLAKENVLGFSAVSICCTN